MTSRLRIRMGTWALSLCVAAQSTAAYEYPLGDHSVREAYFLGRTTDGVRLARFLGEYVRRFELPAKGPYVAEIEFRTPYQQVVLRSWQNSVGYSAQQAQKDYAAQPDLVVVRVLIFLTPTYQDLIAPPSRGKRRAVGRREGSQLAFSGPAVYRWVLEGASGERQFLVGQTANLCERHKSY